MADYDKPLGAAMRRLILERDDWTCRYCGRKPRIAQRPATHFTRAQATMHVDHVWPRSRGGGNWAENLVAACVPCNLEKHDNVWVPNHLNCAQCLALFEVDEEDPGVSISVAGVLYHCADCEAALKAEWEASTDMESECGYYSDLELEQASWDRLISQGWDAV